MKKTFALILGAVLCLMAPTAAGTDPLISRSYLDRKSTRLNSSHIH